MCYPKSLDPRAGSAISIKLFRLFDLTSHPHPRLGKSLLFPFDNAQTVFKEKSLFRKLGLSDEFGDRFAPLFKIFLFYFCQSLSLENYNEIIDTLHTITIVLRTAYSDSTNPVSGMSYVDYPLDIQRISRSKGRVPFSLGKPVDWLIGTHFFPSSSFYNCPKDAIKIIHRMSTCDVKRTSCGCLQDNFNHL